jgi:hypothetical protein
MIDLPILNTYSTIKTIQMKIAQKKYTESMKLSTLRILQKNDYNYLKSEKLTGVSRKTIKKWEISLGAELLSGKSPAEEALAVIDAEMTLNDINIIRNLYLLRKGTLQKVMQIAEQETKLESLLNVLKFASAELEKFSILEKSEPLTTTDFVAYITNIMFSKKDSHTDACDQE